MAISNGRGAALDIAVIAGDGIGREVMPPPSRSSRPLPGRFDSPSRGTSTVELRDL